MNIILFDGNERSDLLPLTLTRPVAEIRMGILTFTERWKKILGTESVSFLTEKYLSGKFPIKLNDENIFINPLYFPDQNLILTIKSLKQGEALSVNGCIIAANTNLNDFHGQKFNKITEFKLSPENFHIQYPWDLFNHNAKAISYDYRLITQNRKSCPLPESVMVIGDRNKIFLEEGVTIEYAILNTKEGEIYLGKNSEVMEGAMIRGTFALCEEAKINMGAKVYGETTIGPHSKVGGEVNNIIIIGYSNKGHEGFLGKSVIGEWCNLGADTNSSNLKNNYGEIKCWNYTQSGPINTGLQFCGLIMGDHSKSAINTQFNTGTVVGVSANILTSGFPPKFINSFSWGGNSDDVKFEFNKAIEVAEKAMERRHITLSEEDIFILKHIYNNEF